MEFEVVRAAEDLVDRTALGPVDQPGALDQPWPEHRVRQVGLSLVERADSVALRRGAAPQGPQLREHEPHPVAALAALPQLAANLGHDRVLGPDEAAEVERVRHGPPRYSAGKAAESDPASPEAGGRRRGRSDRGRAPLGRVSCRPREPLRRMPQERSAMAPGRPAPDARKPSGVRPMPLELDRRFARRRLAFWPSPVHPLPRLSEELGLEVWAKRDDIASGLAFGGNKVRKLEWLAADALAQGCDTLVSIGNIQSNHTRQVAAVAAVVGMR